MAIRRFNAKRETLTAEYARSVVRYCPDSGLFYRVRSSSRSPAGSVTGTTYGNGYIRISIDCTEYLAHRLAWFITYGVWPEYVDHINGDKTDNRLCNLREATNTQNCGNMRLRRDNVSGFKGVSYRKRGGRYMARIVIDRKTIYLGTFLTAQEAHAAYLMAAKEHFKEFARAA